MLKVAHHGADTSTIPHGSLPGPTWLEAISPGEVVITAGTHNGFGHPRCNVVEALDTAPGMTELVEPAQATCATGRGEDAWTVQAVTHAVWSTWDDGYLQLTVSASGAGMVSPVEFE